MYMGGGGGGLYLMLYCHHQNDSALTEMGSGVSETRILIFPVNG